uniref:NADH dehydrogenase subunit 11 n=2 Tax=Thraustochytriidae TaxID=33674 RepID=A0A481XHU1_9STRA|nr:NADH dehydrogenase subunit 11 [Aurantiochytrium acetophilum]
MISLYINNSKVLVQKNSTVFQACAKVGVVIPRFCFHERLLIAGNCRICLVEIEKFPKPVASCAMPVSENIKIFTDTPLVKKAREAVIEFLLINHPLDCPICDQGGECDLQNQSFHYGTNSSRFFSKKRSVVDKNVGPFISIIITRCIHCTRCVRFLNEVAGYSFFGITGRGYASEIGTFVQKSLKSKLSGNIIDLCPVGFISIKKYNVLY